MNHDLLVSYSEAKVKDMTLEEFEKIQQENWYLTRAFCNKLQVEEGKYYISRYGRKYKYFKTHKDAVTFGSNIFGNEDEYGIYEND
tara:strand:+ start:13845 stop:14102 length:258 start_codon:yes stop_codon:yes gene_type:complete